MGCCKSKESEDSTKQKNDVIHIKSPTTADKIKIHTDCPECMRIQEEYLLLKDDLVTVSLR